MAEMYFSSPPPPPHKYSVGSKVRINAPSPWEDPEGLDGLEVVILECFYIDLQPFYGLDMRAPEGASRVAIHEQFLSLAEPRVKKRPELGDWATIESLLQTDIRKD